MDDQQWLTERFQQHRPHLRAVAYRMLGSLADADDAVQDAWERVSRARADEVGNLKAWLTTIVARVCLNLLRSRNAQREESLEVSVPDPIVTLGGPDPEQQLLLAEGVGLALQVVIDTLAPAERLAFVLHDLFDLPFEEIAPSPAKRSRAQEPPHGCTRPWSTVSPAPSSRWTGGPTRCSPSPSPRARSSRSTRSPTQTASQGSPRPSSPARNPPPQRSRSTNNEEPPYRTSRTAGPSSSAR